MSPKTFVKALLMLPCIATAAGPTGMLNDTGQIRCLNSNGSGLEPCSYENTGNFTTYPGQDGRYGRDAAAADPKHSGFTKPAGSGGKGGFAFMPLDVSGNQIPLKLENGKWVPSETPRCIWDRVTNLIWEVKTNDSGIQDKDWTYGWGSTIFGRCYESDPSYPKGCSSNNYIADLIAESICPVSGAGQWRLPTRRELLSIVDSGSLQPVIDEQYFENTSTEYSYLSVSTSKTTIQYTCAWLLNFSNGTSECSLTSNGPVGHIRLVKSGN